MWLAVPSILEDEDVPEGLRKYFASYAKRTQVLGHEVLVVSQLLSWRWEDDRDYRDKQHGVGPMHTVDQRSFELLMPMKKDTRPGANGAEYHQSLGNWIDLHISRGGKKFSVLHQAQEHRDACYSDD